MEKHFRPWNVNQPFLLPPSIDEFVPEGHLARFVRELVTESLDLSAIVGAYRGPKGYPPYDAGMMTALLLYSYAVGVFSSRKIAKACEERLDFITITGLDRPDFRTIADFRRRHFSVLGDLFVQVLKLCQKAGLVKLGHVALDGTKILANASKHKAMSYGRMKDTERKLRTEIDAWFKKAAAADQDDDGKYGQGRRGDELPEWVQDKQARLTKIREARREMEREAKAAHEEQVRQAKAEGKRPPSPEKKKPEPRKQINFTDPESRIMKGRDGFVQAYNAQAAVDAHKQIIVAADLTDCAGDNRELPKLMRQTKANCGRQAREASADSGYWSQANANDLHRRRVKGYIALSRKLSAPKSARRSLPVSDEAKEMQRRLRQGGHRSRYRLRKTTVEPVFGQIKSGQGFRRFSCRGVENARAEWRLVSATHNLRKLYGAKEPSLAGAHRAGQASGRPFRASEIPCFFEK